MGLFNLFDPVLNFLLGPVLHLPSLIALVLITFAISLLITLAYKYITDQDLMKQLKDELKEFQQELKTLKDKPEKAMKVQKQMMETNMKYMAQSLKPTLYTFIPIIIVFGWLSAHLAYLPLAPQQEFSVELLFDSTAQGNVTVDVPTSLTLLTERSLAIVDHKARFGFKGDEGEYVIAFQHDGKSWTKKVLLTTGINYYHPLKRQKTFIDALYSQNDVGLDRGTLREIKTSNASLKPFGESFSLFGWKPGWLGTYIIFSIIFSMILRKVLNVY